MESAVDLKLEVLQRWHLQCFTVKYQFGFGATI